MDIFRYPRLYGHFLRFAASKAMQFRAELAFRVLMDVIFYAVFLGFYEILYQHTASIGSWNREQALVFITGYLLVDSLQMTFFSDMYFSFGQLYRDGTLDHSLTKPVSSWFFVGFRYINFGSIANVIIASSLWIWALSQYQGPKSIAAVLVYAALLGLGALLYFLVIFSLLMVIFWTESTDGALSTYFECVNFASRPHHIFKGFLKSLLMSVIPFSVFASIPAQAFFDEIGWASIAHIFGVVSLFLMLNFTLWRLGLRRYASAQG